MSKDETERQYVVLAGVGPDRQGLVAQLTETIRKLSGNLEDSHMAQLGTEFGVQLLCSGPAGFCEALQKALPGLERETGMTLLARETKPPGKSPRTASLPCAVSGDSLDHEGIVHAVSSVLHRLGLNIVSLETKRYPAPVTGALLFQFRAIVELPSSLSIAGLREHLAPLADQERIDLDVRALHAR